MEVEKSSQRTSSKRPRLLVETKKKKMDPLPPDMENGAPKGRAQRNVQRISFVEEKLPRVAKVTSSIKKKPSPANNRKRKLDNVSVVLESEIDVKRAKSTETVGSSGANVEPVLWKTLKDQKQDELEELLINKAFAKPPSQPKRSKPEAHPEDFPSQQAAQKYCLNDPTLIVSNLSIPGAEMVGQLAKIYWDGEDTWFYARVLNFNPNTGEYFIYYFEDSTGEWIDFNNEAAIICKEIVLAHTTKTALLWPAMTFHVFPKAQDALRKYPAFNSHGVYVEFLHGDGKYEYGFVHPSLIESYDETRISKKSNKKLIAAVEEAHKAKEAQEQVVQQVQDAIRKSVLILRKQEQLVGTRVRSSTSRILTRAERKMKPEERTHIISAFCVGTITQYCPVKDQYLISFDDAHLQPQWVTLDATQHNKDVEILLSSATAPTLTSSSSEVHDDQNNEQSLVVHDVVKDTNNADDCETTNNLEFKEENEDDKELTLPLCGLCKHECDDDDVYGQEVLHCHRCQTTCHDYCLPAGELIPVNAAARLKASQWLCWRCTDCFNCATTSWHTPLIYWSSKNQVSRLSDSRTLLLCGWCLKHYKHTKEYCVVCYKLYVYQQHQSDRIDVSYASDINMVQCHQCDRWVHASCEGMDEKQYESISDGTHPIWGDEYLCPLCRVQLCRDVMKRLFALDTEGIFSMPVTEDIAANYFDIIHNPMDFSTMLEKVERGMYKSLQPLRQDAELVALNALIFNRDGDPVWKAAQNLFIKLSELFLKLPRHSSRSAFGREAEELIQRRHMSQTGQMLALPAPSQSKAAQEQLSVADRGKSVDNKMNNKRAGSSSIPQSSDVDVSSKQQEQENEDDMDNMSQEANSCDEYSEDDDSDLSSDGDEDEEVSIQAEEMPLVLSQLVLEPNPDMDSFLPPRMSIITAEEAKTTCAQDCCFSCGASSEGSSLLHCCDCGEAVHFFCAGIDEVQFNRMDLSARHAWRCVNCKVCEICLVPHASDAQTLLFCEKCDRSFHISCLRPSIPTLPDFTFICGICVQCELCAVLRPVRDNTQEEDQACHWGNCANLCILCQDMITTAVSPAATAVDTMSLLSKLQPLQPNLAGLQFSKNYNREISTNKSNVMTSSLSSQSQQKDVVVDEAKRFLVTWIFATATTHLYNKRCYGENIEMGANKHLSKPAAKSASKGNKRAAVDSSVSETPANENESGATAVNSTSVDTMDRAKPLNANPEFNASTVKMDIPNAESVNSVSSFLQDAALIEKQVLLEETQKLQSCRSRRFAALVRRRVHASNRVGHLSEGIQLHINNLSQVQTDGLERMARLSAAYISEADPSITKSISEQTALPLTVSSLLEIVEACLALLQSVQAFCGASEYSSIARPQIMAVYQQLDRWVRQNYKHLSTPVSSARKAREVMLQDLNKIFDDTSALEIMHAMQVVAKHIVLSRTRQINASGEALPVSSQQVMAMLSSLFPTAFNVLCSMSEAISNAAVDLQPIVRKRKLLDCMAGLALDLLAVRNSMVLDTYDFILQKLPSHQQLMMEKMLALSEKTDMLRPLSLQPEHPEVTQSTVGLSFPHTRRFPLHPISLPLTRHILHNGRLRKLCLFDVSHWSFVPLKQQVISDKSSFEVTLPLTFNSLSPTQQQYLQIMYTTKQSALNLLEQAHYVDSEAAMQDSAKIDVLIDALHQDITRKLQVSSEGDINNDLAMAVDEDQVSVQARASSDISTISQRCCLCGTGDILDNVDVISSKEWSENEKLWHQWEQEKGRLMPLGDTRHVHVNCLRWCEEVRESAGGLLHNAISAVDINQRVKCSLCGQLGASLVCLAQQRCRQAYHITCARAMDCLLLQRVVQPFEEKHKELLDKEDEDEEDGLSRTGLCLLCHVHLHLCPSISRSIVSSSVSIAQTQGPESGKSRIESKAQQYLSRHRHGFWRHLPQDNKKRFMAVQEIDSDDDDEDANPAGSSKSSALSIKQSTPTQNNVTSTNGNKASSSNGIQLVKKGIKPTSQNEKDKDNSLSYDHETLLQRRLAGVLVDRRVRGDKGLRLGALTIHCLGQLVVPSHPQDTSVAGGQDNSEDTVPQGHGFVTRHYLYPVHFSATRVFWSYVTPFRRTAYHCEVLSVRDIVLAVDTAVQLHAVEEIVDINENTSYVGDVAQLRRDLLIAIFNQLFSLSEDTSDGSLLLEENENVADFVSQFDGPIFRITPEDDASHAIYALSVSLAHRRLQRRLQQTYAHLDTTDSQHSNNSSNKKRSCIIHLTRGLTPHQFFGLGVPVVRRATEMCPEAISAMLIPEANHANTNYTQIHPDSHTLDLGVAVDAATSVSAVVTTEPSDIWGNLAGLGEKQRYRPTYRLPSSAEVLRLERRRRRLQAQQQQQMFAQRRKKHLCSRAQSLRPSTSQTPSTNKTNNNGKLRTKEADAEDGGSDSDSDTASVSTSLSTSVSRFSHKTNNSSSNKRGRKRGGARGDDVEEEVQDNEEEEEDDDEDKELDAERRARQREEEELEKEAQADDRRQRFLQMRQAFETAPNSRLLVRRSGIHGWGLFSRVSLDKDAVIVEYVGEQIRQCVADRRELLYEEEGVGSCYLFRLDKHVIVDATRSGGMARFINHSCDPNAYARIIPANTRPASESPTDGAKRDEEEKHIVIMALREIQPGEEITYDYKFPIEDKKLMCYCGSARCSGSMN